MKSEVEVAEAPKAEEAVAVQPVEVEAADPVQKEEDVEMHVQSQHSEKLPENAEPVQSHGDNAPAPVAEEKASSIEPVLAPADPVAVEKESIQQSVKVSQPVS